jgi:transcriptional regulator with XRE-family HTH domain
MIVGDRLRAIREDRKLSQGDVELRTGLLRCYISRVENGHTVPALETLEKFARALETPLYAIFYDGELPPSELATSPPNGNIDRRWGVSGKHMRFLRKLRMSLAKMSKSDREALLLFAQKLVAGKHTKGQNAAG